MTAPVRVLEHAGFQGRDDSYFNSKVTHHDADALKAANRRAKNWGNPGILMDDETVLSHLRHLSQLRVAIGRCELTAKAGDRNSVRLSGTLRVEYHQLDEAPN